MADADEAGNEESIQDVQTMMSNRTTVDFNQPDSLVGRSLDGRFLIEKILMEGGAYTGGFGFVDLAKDTKLMGRDVVVKILNETALKYPDIVRKFQHEKEALIRLDHPGIVRILDSGTLMDGNPFMVMDYIQGHSLRKAIQLSGKLPIEFVANIIESITDALTAAHSAKVLHRDIKPENIMLTPLEEGLYRVRLIDFGIARVEDSQLAPATEISRAIGSVLYIAPEQLIGNLDLTPAADIFSTAIVAYELLTGELPFKPRAIAEMYQLEREGVQTPPSALRPDMPREAERILLWARECTRENGRRNERAFGRYLVNERGMDSLESDRFFASVQTEFSKSPTQFMPVPDTVGMMTVQTVQRATPEPSPAVKSSNRTIFLILGAVFLVLFSSAAGFMVWSSLKQDVAGTPPAVTPAPPIAGPVRELSYFLMVQKMRDGKPYEEPFKSPGNVSIEHGYKITLNFVSDTEGYVYILNEDKGGTVFNLIFPTPSVNGGSAQTLAGRPIETFSSTIKGAPGTEVIWIFWAKEKRDDIEAALKSAMLPDVERIVKDPANVGVLKGIIEKFGSVERDAVYVDPAKRQMVIKAKGDLILHRFELAHQ